MHLINILSYYVKYRHLPLILDYEYLLFLFIPKRYHILRLKSYSKTLHSIKIFFERIILVLGTVK